MYKKFIFIIVYFIFISCSNEKQNFLENISFGDDTTLDIVTWNIENFPKHSSTIEEVSELIISLNSDIIALQEISNESDFNSLVNLLDSEKWSGYRAGNDGYQSLAYLINTSNIEIIQEPYTILEDQEYQFAYRPPYVVKIKFYDQEYILIDVHLKCCGDGEIDWSDSGDEEVRRYYANQLLKSYIEEYFFNENVIILGDFNDELIDSNNIFLDFINDQNYLFADIDIANGSSLNWSFPSWPSHLDHILVYNKDYYFNNIFNVQTLRLDDYIIGGWDKYDNIISDHRPVGINLLLSTGD